MARLRSTDAVVGGQPTGNRTESSTWYPDLAESLGNCLCLFARARRAFSFFFFAVIYVCLVKGSDDAFENATWWCSFPFCSGR